MLRLILLAGAVFCAWADSCDFKPYYDCTRPSAPRYTRGPRGGKSPERQCLDDAGCQSSTPTPRGAYPTESQSNRAAREQVSQCYENVINSVKADIQNCVRKQVPDFSFPDQKSGSGKGKGGRGGSSDHGEDKDGDQEGSGNKQGGIEHLIDVSCTTPDSKSRALACVKALQKKSNGRNDDANRSNQLCQKRTDCLRSLTPQCQQQFMIIEQAKCSCANSVTSANSNKIETSYNACGANLLNPSSRSDGRGEKRKDGGFKAGQLAKQYCPRDPCKPASSSD